MLISWREGEQEGVGEGFERVIYKDTSPCCSGEHGRGDGKRRGCYSNSDEVGNSHLQQVLDTRAKTRMDSRLFWRKSQLLADVPREGKRRSQDDSWFSVLSRRERELGLSKVDSGHSS